MEQLDQPGGILKILVYVTDVFTSHVLIAPPYIIKLHFKYNDLCQLTPTFSTLGGSRQVVYTLTQLKQRPRTFKLFTSRET